MQPSLQEIADAAIRDIDARNAKRIRRARKLAAGTKQVPKKKIVRIKKPLAEAFKEWEHELISNPKPVAAPSPHKRYLWLGVAGIVLVVASAFGLAWARESATWRNEEWARQREALLLQGKALHGQIANFTQHTKRMEEKARLLTQQAKDLRDDFPGNDVSPLLKQADRVLADRDQLNLEIENRRQRLAGLRDDLAALNAR